MLRGRPLQGELVVGVGGHGSLRSPILPVCLDSRNTQLLRDELERDNRRYTRSHRGGWAIETADSPRHHRDILADSDESDYFAISASPPGRRSGRDRFEYDAL